MGYKNFNEREFLKAVKQLGEITTYFSSNPTAKHFIKDVIAPHCGYDCSDVYAYMNQKIMERIPEKREEIFSLGGWKEFYNFIIKKSNKCPKLAEFLSYGVNFFNKIETFENYFRLATKVLDIDADDLMNLYTLHTLHWIDVVDTMVKMANETLGETKKEEKSEDVETSSSVTSEEPVVSEKEETGVEKPEISQSESTPDTDVPEQVNSEYDDEPSSSDVSGEDSSTSMESEHSDVDVKETPIPRESSDRKEKRGYDIPIVQYKRGEIFPDVETASEKTGISVEEILKSMETRPNTKVDIIWKYTNKQKKEVIQFVYLHTYRNQVDIKNNSKSVCGKEIHRSNVAAKLNSEWSSVSKEEFVWIRLLEVDKIKSDTYTFSKCIEKDMISDDKINSDIIEEKYEGKKSGEHSTGLFPIVKYTGGKGKELKYIIPALPESFERYIEPFVGGGSVFMGIRANQYIINDKSSDLISLYRSISKSDKEFFRYIKLIDESWTKAKRFSDSKQEGLRELFLSYNRKEISDYDFKFGIALFCEENEDWLFDITKDFGNITPIFSNQVEIYLNKQMKKIQEKKLSTPNPDLETSVKSALYVCFRELYNDKDIMGKNPSLHAALFFFIRNYTFRGMDRYDSNGKFNVSYGGQSYNSKSMESKTEYFLSEDVLNHFKQTHIYNLDFEDFLNEINPTEKDFIFLDPPYDCQFTKYANNDFDEDDQIRLSNYLLTRCKAKWMMVIGKTEFIYKLYNKEGIHIQEYDYQYNINIKNRNKRNTKHLLITNYELNKESISKVEIGTLYSDKTLRAA